MINGINLLNTQGIAVLAHVSSTLTRNNIANKPGHTLHLKIPFLIRGLYTFRLKSTIPCQA